VPWQIFDIQFALPAFAMVLFRVGGLTISSPLVGSPVVPARVKIAFSLVVSLMLFPMVWTKLPVALGWPSVVLTVFGELLIGLVIGLAVDLVFLGVRLAGVLIGQQAGIALGQVVNPMLEGESTIVDQLYYLVTLMVFLGIGGHRVMVRALLDTFDTIPPGSFGADPSIVQMLGELLSAAFIVGLRLAAPALTALFIASLAMGFIARTIPQLNILTIGFAVRVFVGLTVAAFALTLSFDVLYDAILDVFDLLRPVVGQ